MNVFQQTMRTITFAGPNIVETKNGVKPDQIWSRHKNMSQTKNGQKIIWTKIGVVTQHYPLPGQKGMYK